MKYIKKYNFLFEREDLQKREEILIFLDDIVLVIKNHFINIINNLIEGKNEVGDYAKIKNYNKILTILDFRIIDETLKIPLDEKYKFIIDYQIEDDSIKGGSYTEDNDGSNFLKIGLGKNFNKIIKNIFITKSSNLAKIRNEIENYKLDKDANDVIFHELIHATDDMKFNIFKDFLKVTKLRALQQSGKGFNDPEFTEEYFKNYPNFTSEYNAYFMMATNMLMNNIKNNVIDVRKLKEFSNFKKYFVNLTKKYYNLYTNTTKFKKHFDKRMYDLYTKIKEKYL